MKWALGSKRMSPVLAWWFAGGVRARGVVPEVGVTERIAGKPRPGQHGLHGARSVLSALAYAQTPTLCRVRLEGAIAEDKDQIAATERTVLWSADVSEILRTTISKWIARALAEAGEHDAIDPRLGAERARARVHEAEDRVRDAEWLLEEGAGRREGEARAKALGEARGARYAVREARAAAYAHEAAIALAGGDIRAIARAAELVVDSLDEISPESRARLDRELERAFEDAGALTRDRDRESSPGASDRIVPAADAPDRGAMLLAALGAVLEKHVGVLGVYPLVLPNIALAVLVACTAKSVAQSLARAIDASAELRAAGLEAMCGWDIDGETAEGLVGTHALSQLARSKNADAAIAEALRHPAISQRDPLCVLRARLFFEPSVVAAAWLRASPVLAVELASLDAPARAGAARLAAHYPRLVIRSAAAPGLVTTLESVDVSDTIAVEEALGRPIYRRGMGLRDPSRPIPSIHESGARFAPFVGSTRRSALRSSFEGSESRQRWIARQHLLRERSFGVASDAPRWAIVVRDFCQQLHGMTDEAWALGGDRVLAERLLRARIAPVAIDSFDELAIEVLGAAHREGAFAELGLGIVIRSHRWGEAPRDDYDVLIAPRLRAALDFATHEQLLSCLALGPTAPLLNAAWDPRDAVDMQLRWLLFENAPESECAAWLFGNGGALDTLAILAGSRREAESLEAILDQQYEGMPVIQIWPRENELLAEAIEHDRWRCNAVASRRGMAELTKAQLAKLAAAFARPDVYEREWMLAEPQHEASTRGPEWMDPNAHCPSCDTEYWLAPRTAIEGTRCGVCDHEQLLSSVSVIAGLFRDSMALACQCPKCHERFRAALGDAIHVRCPHCSRAVEPIEV